MEGHEDKRPDPKPRKHPLLWQSYLWWNELVEMRKRHRLRIVSIERGKSNMLAPFERDVMERLGLDERIDEIKGEMIGYGREVGVVWDWLTSIKGLAAGGLAAQLLAQFDDVGKFDTVSKFWRFSGWAVVDGKIDRCQRGQKSPYNRRLKSICYLVAEQFLRQQTEGYVDIYYDEKERQRRLHPEVMCRECEVIWTECKEKKGHHKQYNDGHLHNRAMRKMAKIFLQHLWVTWRESEGLPVSEPYVQAVMGHTNIIEPSDI